MRFEGLRRAFSAFDGNSGRQCYIGVLSTMFTTSQHVHFIGIGGIAMSGIAEILLNLGMKVSGSDLRRGQVTDRLATLGATIYEGHDASHVGAATVVVTSSAVSPMHPE